MFGANLHYMAEAIEDMRKIPKQLNHCMEELSESLRMLQRYSYFEETQRALGKEAEILNVKVAQTMQLSRTLEAIREHYLRSDREAADYCEENQRVWRREQPDYYQMDWISEFLRSNHLL